MFSSIFRCALMYKTKRYALISSVIINWLIADIFKSQVDEQGKLPQSPATNNNSPSNVDLSPKSEEAQEGGCSCWTCYLYLWGGGRGVHQVCAWVSPQQLCLAAARFVCHSFPCTFFYLHKKGRFGVGGKTCWWPRFQGLFWSDSHIIMLLRFTSDWNIKTE